MSATQVSSGRLALKSRLTRSGAGAARLSGVVVRPAPTRDALDLELAHQPGDALLADPQALCELQLGVQARSPVGLVGVLPGREDPRLQPLVVDAPAAGGPLPPGPVALPGDVQHRAQQGDGVVRALVIDSWNVMAADLSPWRNTLPPSAGSASPPRDGGPGDAALGSRCARRS